jgi:hypothetical protein
MSAANYDPELPFLAELEQRVHDYAEETASSRLERASSLGAGAAAPARRSRLVRMTRRTAVLAALLCLLAATALGTRAAFFDTAPNPIAVQQGPFVLVASGHASSDRWTLRLYTRDRELCRALVVLDEQASSRCAPAPSARALSVTSAASALHLYVFGVTGDGVRAVAVSAGTASRTVATATLSNAQRHAGGITGAVRYFLVVLPLPLDSADPTASVTGLDAAHRRLDGPQFTCGEEAAPTPCR